MFSFKKKDKDKTIETKEERRERRKKEKEKDKHKADRKAHGELGNIVAGSDNEEQKKGRFSFRKADKRRYEVEHGYDGRNPSPGVERSDFAARTGRSGSTDTTGSAASGSVPSPYLFGSSASVSSNAASPDTAHQAGYRDSDEEKRYQNEVSQDGKPVPKPRVKRKKSSSIEIKLQSPRQAYDSYENKTGDASNEQKRAPTGEMNGTSAINVRPSDEPISASPLNDKHVSPESPPPKPPRILADRTGVVEFEVKLINVGSENDRNKANSNHRMEVDGPITATSTVQSFAEAPLDDLGEPKIVLPPRDVSRSSESLLSPSEKTLEEMGVDLKLPEVQPAISGVARVIKLKRRSSGDFGFALRRANAPGSGKTVHFVEPVGANGSGGLLPGDRLVEVNGVNVESESRERIIEMIVMSGEEVVIKVIPVPELSELSVRSGLDGSTVQLDESNLKAGTLARSGSKRIKKKVSVHLRVLNNNWVC